MPKYYSKLTERIYMQLSPELSQEFHNMLTDMASELSRLYEIENAKPSEAMKCLEDVSQAPSFMGGNPKYYYAIKSEIPFMQDINTIKQALIRLDDLDEKLTFKGGCFMSGFDNKDGKQVVAMPLSEYSRLMEQEDVLSIIKEKRVIIAWFEDGYLTLQEYNAKCEFGYELTKEEFDALKRYFENE